MNIVEAKKAIPYMIEQFKKCEIHLSENKAKQFYDYYKVLVETNEVMNLTTIVEFEEVVMKHFIDSICQFDAVLDYSDEELEKGLSLIDVGTGAGFPGIPIKIMYPQINLTLLDSLQKRVEFLKNVAQLLDLKNIKFIHGRAEDIAHEKQYREKYDIAIARAVANLATLSEYMIPFVKIEGLSVSMKAGDIEEEVQNAEYAITELGGALEDIISFVLPETDIERNIIVIRKEEKTNRKYPRKAGTPAKHTLSAKKIL